MKMLRLLQFVAAALATGSAIAQTAAPCVIEDIFSYGYGIATGSGATSFRATLVQTYEQRLADGNRIHRTLETLIARSSDSRSLRQSLSGCEQMEGGQIAPRFSVRVIDSKARTDLSWQIGGHANKSATRTYFGAPLPGASVPNGYAPMQPSQRAQAETRREDLGTKIIQGLTAHGWRTTRTIPAGAEGNDAPLLVVSEHWDAVKERFTLLAIEHDPRHGLTRTELKDLVLGELDPALFAPPEGYDIKDRNSPPAVASH